jgi:hypothetical protein
MAIYWTPEPSAVRWDWAAPGTSDKTIMAKFPILPITPPGTSLRPTATTWVMKDPDAETGMRQIRVEDMSDTHVWSWIKYFRKKWREKVVDGTAPYAKLTEAAIDAHIRASMITAPAIYAEAKKRNCMPPDAPAAPPFGQMLQEAVEKTVLVSKKAVTPQQLIELANALKPKKPTPTRVEPGPPGVRHINLDDE